MLLIHLVYLDVLIYLLCMSYSDSRQTDGQTDGQTRQDKTEVYRSQNNRSMLPLHKSEKLLLAQSRLDVLIVEAVLTTNSISAQKVAKGFSHYIMLQYRMLTCIS